MIKETAPRMTREAVEASLKRGEHVGTAGGAVLRKGADLRPHFTADEDGGRTTEIPAVVVRDEHGNITRAGMEHALRSGGSVLYGGEVHTSLDTLPDEIELAEHDEKAKAAIAASIDQQIAALTAQRARATAPAATKNRSEAEHKAEPKAKLPVAHQAK